MHNGVIFIIYMFLNALFLEYGPFLVRRKGKNYNVILMMCNEIC